MTALEKLKNEHPEQINDNGDARVCPMYLGYLPKPDGCGCSIDCDECWNREIPETPEKIVDALCAVGNVNPISPEELKAGIKRTEHPRGVFSTGPHDKPFENPTIKDSGTRREFETGAVRDIQEGKGRCDLLPLDVVAEFMTSPAQYRIMGSICDFQNFGDWIHLKYCLQHFIEDHLLVKDSHLGKVTTMLLEVAKHFEEGAKKYGEYNWQKGIPTHCYIDSAVRHYLKYLRGDTDEPHDRAFVWNILCCIWTCKHKPELNDYAACEDSPVKKVIVKTETGPQKMDISDQPVEEATE